MTNNLIKANYPKLTRAMFASIIIIWIFISVYFDTRSSPDREKDETKKTNVNITKQIAYNYCIKNKKCPSSLNNLFSDGYTGPYKNFNFQDYFLRSIDDGRDCVIYTVLSNKSNYARLCIGNNLKYIKYLIDPNY